MGKNIFYNKLFFSERTMILRYEDMAREPEKITRQILNFSDLGFYSEVKEWLAGNFQEGPEDGGQEDGEKRFQTYGRNSSDTPFKWKQKLTYRKCTLNINHMKSMGIIF